MEWKRVVESRTIDVDFVSWASKVDCLSGFLLCGVWSMSVGRWATEAYEVVGVVHVT